jgi:MFS family permease
VGSRRAVPLPHRGHVDTTILNVALPSLVRDLHATSSGLQWIVDAYTVVFAGLLLSAGSLGDRFGRRGVLSAGLAFFAIASGASALATSSAQLIALRALTGVPESARPSTTPPAR